MKQIGLFIFIIVVFGPLLALIINLVQSLLDGNGEWLVLVLPAGRRLVLLLRSLGLAAGVSVSGMALGILGGSVLWRWDTGLGRYLRWLVLVLAPIPPYVHALAWSSTVFAANSTLGSLGLPEVPLQGWIGSWWVQLMSLAPIAVGLTLLGLKSVEPRLIDAARVMQSDIRSFVRVIFPLAAPTIIAGGCVLFLLSVMDYSVPSLFQVNVYSLELFAEYGASNELARVFLLAIPLLIIAICVVLISQSALRKVVQNSSWNIPTWNVFPRWPTWFVCLQVVAVVVLVAQIVVPLVSLITEVGTWNNMASTITNAGSEISFTFWIAALSAVICLPLTLAAARELLRQDKWGKLWWVLVLAPLAISPPLTGVGLIYIWNRSIFPGVYGSSLMPVLAALARFAPFAAIVLAVQLRRIEPLLIEAARIIQSNRYRTWFRIWLPMLAPGLVAACGVVFALTVGELGATLIVAPPGRATLTMMIYNFLHYGATSAVAGLCLMMAFISVMAGTLAVFALMGWYRLYPGRA